MLTDIQIAQQTELNNIKEVAAKIGITEDDLEMYGKYKAKLSDEYMDSVKDNKNGKLVLVTAINPTPYGDELALNVNTEDNSISIDLAIESAQYFCLSVDEKIVVKKLRLTSEIHTKFPERIFICLEKNILERRCTI